MEKKLFAIECRNVVLAIRPNGDTVIVTESNELVLDNAVMNQLVRNSGAYKSFVTAENNTIAELECYNTELQNKIVGLREELEQVKAAKDKLQLELTDTYDATEPMVKECIVQVKACRLYDVNGDFLVDCGTSHRAIRVQELLREGKITLDMVMMVFGNTGDKKAKAASKADNEPFD